jgi:Peptidase A4 family
MKRRSLIAGVAMSAGALLCVPSVVGATAAIAPAIVHAARVPVATARSGHSAVRNTWSASNWSGYAETGTFTGVSGTWTVPAVAASSSATYSSAWIGVDGFNDSNLIQTGTEEDYYSGAAHYDAWWEILPASETEISPTTYAVSPGDRMSASIWETSATSGGGRRHSSGHVWDIKISDTTKGWTFSTAQSYTGAGTSAEWIMEAPEVGGTIATLAHYTVTPPAGTGDFDNAGILTSIVSSGTPTYTGAALNYANDSGVMVQNNVQVSTPGDPDTALTAFNFGYGATLPSTPTG